MIEWFGLVDVSSWGVGDTESGGGDEKVWLNDPSGVAWLFKPRTEHDSWVQGEDWAERIATELASRLDIPAASADLAIRGGRRGSISRSLITPGWELQPGALLLSEIVPGFLTQDPARKGHTLDTIERALDGVGPPNGCEPHSAFDVGVLACSIEGFAFSYLAAARRVPDFRPFLGFGELSRRYESATLFPFFAQRVMRPSRPDYPAYVHSLALTEDAEPWLILARSQGARVGDTTRVFAEPEVTGSGRTRHTFFVNGVRHALGEDPAADAALSTLSPGAAVLLRDQRDNPKNPRAVQVITDGGVALGWVPDVLLDYVSTVRSISQPTITVTTVNGVDVPPGFRLLVTLEGQVPYGYEFFSGPSWTLANA